MSWRLQITHRTGYEYAEPVVASYNEARLSPLDGARQMTIEHRIDVDPPTHLFRYRDYWGTRVVAFDVHEPHNRLLVTGQSTVETRASQPRLDGASWDDLQSDAARDRFCEVLRATPFVPRDIELETRAREVGAGLSPREATNAVTGWVHDHLRYEPGATTVQTTAAEVYRERRGVCQDFVHLGLALLRAIGIPARYASGYVYPADDASLGDTVAGQSHAWIEAWLGDWEAFDVTSGSQVEERHVLVARGRDYGDVPPLKGIYHGGPSHAIAVEVALTRVA